MINDLYVFINTSCRIAGIVPCTKNFLHLNNRNFRSFHNKMKLNSSQTSVTKQYMSQQSCSYESLTTAILKNKARSIIAVNYELMFLIVFL